MMNARPRIGSGEGRYTLANAAAKITTIQLAFYLPDVERLNKPSKNTGV